MPDPKQRCVVVGAGGHARVLVDCLLMTAPQLQLEIVDIDPRLHGTRIWDIPVTGDDEALEKYVAQGGRLFVLGIGSSSDTALRRRLYENCARRGLLPHPVIHPSAILSSRAKTAAGIQLLAGCIVNAGASLGENVLVNSGAIVEHDCSIGAHAHIASGAVLAGNVTAGEGAHIGAGAVVRQGIRIGARAVVAAGAAVVRDVPEGETVGGVPARALPSPARK